MQTIAVDVTTRMVTIEIAATRPGDPNYDYTAISEVSLFGTIQPASSGVPAPVTPAPTNPPAPGASATTAAGSMPAPSPATSPPGGL
jgi:hypothetical protein